MDYLVNKIESTKKDIDFYIGTRVKIRRSALGISQDKLGSFLGITFQQIQKYERGTNRISASTLYNISIALSVDFSYFIDGYQNNNMTLNDDRIPVYGFDVHKKKETAELLKAYYKITDQSLRKKILDLIKTFSNSVKKISL